jgi:hypothetical protein
MLHELWVDAEGLDTFCHAGPIGDGARELVGPNAKLIWTVEAKSSLEAMTLYYEYKGWGPYTTDFPEIDSQTYVERGWE